MARQAWPGEEPLGKSFQLGDRFTVVGISGSVRSVRFSNSDTVQAYFPIEERNWPSLSVLVKTSGSLRDLGAAATAAAREVDPDSFPTVDALTQSYRASLQGAEYTALTVSVLGAIAQLLACLGIVGVVSYFVSQRTKEIGIRMALGAQPSHVLSVVLGRLSLPVGAGICVGLAAASGVSHFLRGRLYGLSNFDPGAYAGAVAVFVMTVTIAALLPAQRALRIQPSRALHQE
jgi:ABC-type antimicrobial peptide transport system permease subunit